MAMALVWMCGHELWGLVTSFVWIVAMLIRICKQCFFLCCSEQTGLLCTSDLKKPEGEKSCCSNGVFWLTTKLKSSTCKLIWYRLLKLKKIWSVESVLDVFQLIMLIKCCSPNKVCLVCFVFYKLEQQRKVFSLIMKLVTLSSTGLHRYMMHMVRTRECFCLFFKLILDCSEALRLSTCGQTDSCGPPWPPNFWSHSLMLTKFLYRQTYKHLPEYSNQNQVPFRALKTNVHRLTSWKYYQLCYRDWWKFPNVHTVIVSSCSL